MVRKDCGGSMTNCTTYQVSWRETLEAKNGLSSLRDFCVSHVMSHHLYTNTLMDLEISSLEPVLFCNPRQDKPIHAKLGFITDLFFFPSVFLLSFEKRFASIIQRPGYFKKHYRWHYRRRARAAPSTMDEDSQWRSLVASYQHMAVDQLHRQFYTLQYRSDRCSSSY